MITKEALLAHHLALCDDARVLMAAKNDDYAHGKDPLRNFRRYGAFGVLVRLGDKLARLESFEARGALSVNTESIRDTVIDVINYASLFWILIEEDTLGPCINSSASSSATPSPTSTDAAPER